ncbi:MAG: hypothetical protein J6A47_02530 [Bacilli bacterium]|nr:hypothetical protein [Bacilli bacterium]
MFRIGKVFLGVTLLLSSAFGLAQNKESVFEAQAEDVVSPRIDFSYPNSVQQGNSFTVEVRGSGIKGLAALTMTLFYPTDSFYGSGSWSVWIDEQWGCTYHINDSSEGRIVYSIVAMGERGIDTDESILFFGASLSARENAEIGACRLELNIGEAYDYNLQPMSIPSTHHFVKIEERNIAPTLQRIHLNGNVDRHDATNVYASVYGDWVYDVSAFRCSIVYDKTALSFDSLTLPSELTEDGIYSINSETDGVLLVSYVSTNGHRFAIDELKFSFKRSFEGILSFHVSMEEIYDSNNRPVLCDPLVFETTIESSAPLFSVNKVITGDPEFYVDLRISEKSQIAAADLGIRFDSNLLSVSGIELKIGVNEMMVFDRRKESEGLLPFSYINIAGLKNEKVLARVYFRVKQPYNSFSTMIGTYVEHVVNLSFASLSLRSTYSEVKYNFKLESMKLLSSWDGEIDMMTSGAFYALKGDTFSLKINGLPIKDEEYGLDPSFLRVADGVITVLSSGFVHVDFGSCVSLTSNASYAERADALARRAQGFASRLSMAVGDIDLHHGVFGHERTATLKALMKEYASYTSDIYPYLNPALCQNGFNVGEVMEILRSRLNTAPRLKQTKMNFIVPMGGTFTAKIDVQDDEDVLSFSIPALPSIGTVSVDEDGVLTFKGHRGLYGSEEFRIVISDGVSNVILPVKAVVTDNDAPVAPSEKTLTLGEYSSYRGKVDAFDPEGDILSYRTSLQPGHGTLTLDGSTGIFTYQPKWGFFGFDSFAVDIDDGNHEITQHYYVNVIENKTPKGEPISFAVEKGQEYVGRFQASDADGDALTYSVFEYPNEGSLLLFANGSFVYKPLAYSGDSDYFSIKVSDGYTHTILTAKVSITA